MSKQFRLVHKEARRSAHEAIDKAPDGYIVRVSEPTRSLDANARLWAALNDISEQVDWYGRKLTSEEWKHVLSAGLKKQDVVPGIDGGFVVLGISTSKMTRREFSELIEFAYAFGSGRGVEFTESIICEPA